MRNILKLTGSLSVAGLLGAGSVLSIANAQGVETYLGIHGGVLSGDGEDIENGTNIFNNPDGTFAIGGILGGVLLRNEYWFYGLEGDYGLIADGKVSDPCSFAETCKINWNAHIRGRVGRMVGQIDIFTAVGLALAGFDNQFFDSSVLAGLSVGGGLEANVTNNLRVRVEALGDFYSTHDHDSTYSSRWSDFTVRGAAIYRFPVN